MNNSGPQWSIVVPVFNEQESLPELIKRIARVAESEGVEYEVWLIDDGSTDKSWEIIEQLAQMYSPVHGVKLRRNFGKAAALEAGFNRARGRFIITMDADLQDDPAEVPRLIERLNEGYDVVSGWKKVRHDPWHKVLPSRVFNRMISWLTGVTLHDHNCGLKAYRREVLQEIRLYGELHRFIPVLAASRGFRVTEIPVQHHRRKFGRSKYGVERFVKGFLDLLTVYFLTSYSHRPQHLLGSVGLLSLGLGMFGLCCLTILWMVSRMTAMPDIHLHSRAIFYYCIVALLFGGQLLSVGFLAEIVIARTSDTIKPYSIARETDTPERHSDHSTT